MRGRWRKPCEFESHRRHQDLTATRAGQEPGPAPGFFPFYVGLLLAIATSACTNMSGLGGDSKFKCPVPDELPDEVEDLVQESLLALHLQRGTYDPSLPVGAWVHAIARHKLVDLFRRRGRRESLHEPLDELDEAQHPLVSEEQPARRDLGVLLEAVGGVYAPLLAGGTTAEPVRGGCYVRPTIFAGVKNDMTIAREEIFGPVLSVLSFTDAADVVRQANSNIYGLQAAVWTRDINKAHGVARAHLGGRGHPRRLQQACRSLLHAQFAAVHVLLQQRLPVIGAQRSLLRAVGAQGADQALGHNKPCHRDIHANPPAAARGRRGEDERDRRRVPREDLLRLHAASSSARARSSAFSVSLRVSARAVRACRSGSPAATACAWRRAACSRKGKPR